jgi:hypothetical protein
LDSKRISELVKQETDDLLSSVFCGKVRQIVANYDEEQ